MSQLLNRLYYNNGSLVFMLRPLILFVIIILLVVWAFTYADATTIWLDMLLSNSAMKTQYCELVQPASIFRQPSNSWSNMTYLLYGLFCFEFAWNDYKQQSAQNAITMFPLLSVAWGLSFAYLCFGSFFFHASLTRIGQRWDMAATYALMGAPASILLWQYITRLRAPNHLLNRLKLKSKLPLVLIFILSIDVLFYLFKWQLNSSIFLPALVLLVIALLIMYTYISKSKFVKVYAALSFVSVLLAFLIWQMDRTKQWCDPESLLQGHAIWHVLTGLSSFCLYLYIRSEDTLHKAAN